MVNYFYEDDEVGRLRAALEICFEVLHFNLSHMITDSDDYDQAVRDAADASFYALYPNEKNV